MLAAILIFTTAYTICPMYHQAINTVSPALVTVWLVYMATISTNPLAYNALLDAKTVLPWHALPATHHSISQLPLAYVKSNQGCPPKCKECVSASNCTSCFNEYYLNSNICYGKILTRMCSSMLGMQF